ncbi:helix-turn-helix domain-containing protein [Mycobacterium sp. SMC-13]|uniref:helix-turn-helix domain-containing protein n=1 Tax=Mycobacterium sp. SMC-13 TaxID=3381626 RepID=UPI003875FE55
MQQNGVINDSDGPYWALPASRFGKRVRAQREGAGFTQRELSESLAELGVKLDTSAITRIENGSREPRLREALAIGHALGIGLEAILTFNDDDPIADFFGAYYALKADVKELERWANTALSDLNALQNAVIRSDVQEAIDQSGSSVDLAMVVDKCSDAIDYFEDMRMFTSKLREIVREIAQIPEDSIDRVLARLNPSFASEGDDDAPDT